MNDEDLQKIVEENNTKFNLLLDNKIFKINQIKVFQNDNPVTAPTIRGGVYFAGMKEMKIQATIFDTSITKYLSKAMLGPNKTFLDINIESEIESQKKIVLITNLTNSMQNASKIILYLTLKDARIKSD